MHPKRDQPRAILAIGQQDVDASGCFPVDDQVKIIGITSHHSVLGTSQPLMVSKVVNFNLKYSVQLPLMVSPYVYKEYI